MHTSLSIIKLGLPRGTLLLGSIGLRYDRRGGYLDKLRVHVDRIAVDDLAKSVELLHDVLLGHGCRRQGGVHRFVNAQEGSRKLGVRQGLQDVLDGYHLMEVAILPERAIDNSQRNANCVCCMCCSLPFHDVESVVWCKCPIVVCVRNSTLLVGFPYGQQRINELLSLFYESVEFLSGDVVVAELDPAILVDQLNVAARSIGVKPSEALKASLPETQRNKSLFRMHTETELNIVLFKLHTETHSIKPTSVWS